MVRNIVILGGNSHPQLVQEISHNLGVPPCQRILCKFSVGESRLEIQDSVRGKDVYIIQSGGGKVNDHFIDLCIMISACKTGSARRNTGLHFTTHDYENPSMISEAKNIFRAKPGYKQWVAQAGTLVADLLTCAGADHIITLDLHDPQYQGFFDIPVDNLYGKSLLKKYIQEKIPGYKDAVIVSPDAGGAKRATSIADDLNMEFALIHKERRPTRITERQNATMMLVGDVANRTALLIDDLVDTSNTITRAAKLLKREGAVKVYALLTHGVFSGNAIPRINASALDKVIVTSSIPQSVNQRICPKLEVLEIGPLFAEAIRRTNHGESISSLFRDQ
ncbi:Ribose-phosphate pyrophosphokinase 5 [Golovinomyces cichoracearum]|uniref:Ribose-phosphate pyrophosphokinase 5 n=1 Tax=Golovinomyces cichoracearum TaxID=62708 RepID=A0A420I989_9PEZI|nr:Ribose-phosphate pyrophosphokinase 5 [Golovinomyces cichoracearum]